MRMMYGVIEIVNRLIAVLYLKVFEFLIGEAVERTCLWDFLSCNIERHMVWWPLKVHFYRD